MSSRKALVGLALVMSGLSAGAMAAASTSNGNVNFTGHIVDTPCTVSSESANLAVDLNEVKASVFTQAKDKSVDKDFQIDLLNCSTSTLKTASVAFVSGAHDSNDSTLLAVSGPSPVATGVGIEITNNDGTAIPMGTASSDFGLVDGANSLYFKAHYKSTTGTVTAGSANASTDFQITYK